LGINKNSPNTIPQRKVVDVEKSSAVASDNLFSSGNSLAAEFGWDRGPDNDAEITLDSEDATSNPSYVNTYLREGTLCLRCKQFAVAEKLPRNFGCGAFDGTINFQTKSR
jgi:hypothetical protein